MGINKYSNQIAIVIYICLFGYSTYKFITVWHEQSLWSLFWFMFVLMLFLTAIASVAIIVLSKMFFVADNVYAAEDLEVLKTLDEAADKLNNNAEEKINENI